MYFVFHLLHSVATAFALPNSYGRTCKESHLTLGWPSRSVWDALNSTIGGLLLTPLPPAVVCDPGKEAYDPKACKLVDEIWTTPDFANADPVTLHQPNWQRDACLPPSIYNGSHPCELAPFAKYVVNASSAEHVVEAVKFALKHNLRLSVRNTGHDYLGRSTSPGFQVWTHHLKGLKMHDDFKAKGCGYCPVVPAMTIGAGNQYGEIYNFSDRHNVVVNGGEEPSVGFGGHMTGGGHSPIGSLSGLLVDNVLEVQIVTPTGDLIIANECQHSDLFWATKGGGGSTFGILISATVKTYQNLPAAKFDLTFGSVEGEGTAAFYSLLTDMYAELVGWSDKYINGYFSFGPAQQLALIGIGPQDNSSYGPDSYVMAFGGSGLNQTASDLKRTMSKFVDTLNSTKGIFGALHVEDVPRTVDLLRRKTNTLVGYNSYIASRLWDREAMLDKQSLEQTFRQLEPNIVQGLAISGPAVRDDSRIPLTPVTPTWRRTYLHTLCGATWPHRNQPAQIAARESISHLRNTLSAHAPYMGAYLNEGDVEQPDAEWTFWGKNYERLLEIKRRYDPQGTFWCKPCVGYEDWELDEQTGALCRT